MNSFYMHANKNSRSYQWICTSLRFETEACGNSEILPEIAYQHLHHRSADLRISADIVPLPTSHFLSKNFTNLGIFAETFPTEKNLIKAQKKRKKKQRGKRSKSIRKERRKGRKCHFFNPETKFVFCASESNFGS